MTMYTLETINKRWENIKSSFEAILPDKSSFER